MNSKTDAVSEYTRLRDRGVHNYQVAISRREDSSLEIALNIFRRAVALHESSVSPKIRASAHKNVFACQKLRLKRFVASNTSGSLNQDAFHSMISEACESYRNAVSFGKNEHPDKWTTSLRSEYIELILNAAYTADLERTNELRIAALHRILASTKPSQPFVTHEFNFRLASEMHAASVQAQQEGNAPSAIAYVENAEVHFNAMEVAFSHFEMDMRPLRNEEQVEALRKSITTQHRAAKAMHLIRRAKAALERMDEGASEDALFPIIDDLKEAQQGARNASPLHEAEACAILSKVYSNYEFLKNNQKEWLYVKRAVELFNCIETGIILGADWVADARAKYKHLRINQMREEQNRRTNARNEVNRILEPIRNRLRLIDHEAEGIRFLYERYPPRRGKLPENKLKNNEISGAIKLALLHYHPDRNTESRYGLEYALACEEITTSLNILRRRIDHGWESDFSTED